MPRLAPDAARRADYARGLNDRELGDLWGMSANGVQNWRTRRGLPSNAPEKAKLKPHENARRMALYQQGLNDHEIAEREGVGPTTIAKWRACRSLPVNDRKRPPRPKVRRGVGGLVGFWMAAAASRPAAIMAEIRRALPGFLSPADCEDAASDLYLAMIEAGGDPSLIGDARRYGARVANSYASRFGPRSLDETLREDGDLRMIDMLRDDRSSAWLEEMGATSW